MSRIARWIQDDAGLKDGAALRVLLGSPARTSWRTVALYVAASIALMAVVIVGGYFVLRPTGTPSAQIFAILFIPTVLGQFVVSAAAFGSTVHMTGTQRRRQTWDQFRATAGGTTAAMRAAWAATVYYRLSGPLIVLVYVPRLILLALLLWDLTAFRGEYLTMIAGGHTPVLSPLLEYPLFGAVVAAAFMLPLSAVGLEAAVGLLFSTFARSRQTASLIQIVLTVARIAWSVPVVLFARDAFLFSASGGTPDVPEGWLTFLLNGAMGDWGFGGLHAGAVDTVAVSVPYAGYLGVALLGVVLLHSGLTALILRWAARRAQRIE